MARGQSESVDRRILLVQGHPAGALYVLLSRVTTLEGVFLINFKKELLHADPEVIVEMARLRSDLYVDAVCSHLPIVLFRRVENAPPPLVPSIAALGPTVVYQNVTSLRTSHKFLAAETNELSADVLILAETRVLEAEAPIYPLPGFDYNYFRTEGNQ